MDFDYEQLEQLDYIDYLSFAYSYIETEVYETNYMESIR